MDAARRRLLNGLAGCGIAAAGLADATAARPGPPPLGPVPLSDGVFLVPGVVGEPGPDNAGRVHNALVLRGNTGAVVIDPGATAAQGRALRALLRRALGQDIAALVLTHPHPENVLAASALPGVPLVATESVAALMHARCARCLARLRARVGPAAAAGTGWRLPTKIVDGPSGTLRLAGRRLRWLSTGRGHSDADTTWLDETSGTAHAGGLLYAGCVPDLVESSVDGWIAALDGLESLGTTIFVPAQGSPGGLALPRDTRAYLLALRAAARADVEAGGDGATADRRLALPAFAHLPLYGTRHRLNVQRAWREAEVAFFG